jgi:hypothetical protein
VLKVLIQLKGSSTLSVRDYKNCRFGVTVAHWFWIDDNSLAISYGMAELYY